MHQRIFLNSPYPSPCYFKGLIREILGKLVILTVLLTLIVYTVQGQSNLAINLGDESVLLDQVVVCGGTDEQTVLFTLSGIENSPRTNIEARLILFPGIKLANFHAGKSTTGITLIDDSNISQPVFSFPDLAPNNLTQLSLTFSVETDCSILDTLTTTNNLLVFDRWQLDYEINGSAFSETLEGIEYKDAIAIPNLNIFINDVAGPFGIGNELTRSVIISNSGLNSYLEDFEYQVVQEAGIFYKGLTINGLAVEFSKEINVDNDTLIKANIIGDYFINNTKELGEQGNGDNLFDVDEVINIEETILLVSCGKDGDSNLSTVHQANWGCHNEVCRKDISNATIPIGVGTELIEFSQIEASTIEPGFCEEGNLAITIANNGFEFDDGFGTILDISVGIGFAIGADFLTSDQGFEITSISIAGNLPINSPAGLIELNNNPTFTNDPDGAGGLEDYDGDGFFDDLRVGERFILNATYSISCTAGNNFDIEEDCNNDFRGNFDGKIEYTNPCGEASANLFDNFYRSSITGNTIETCADPDAFNDNSQFTVIYSGERRVTNFNRNCAGNDEVRATISLPDGINLTNQTSFQQDTFLLFPTIQTTANETILVFDASNINLNIDYQFNFIFETQCANVGPTSFPVEITYFCPECDCSHIWYCGILEGTTLHATGAPCTDFVCDIGLQTTNFEVERTSFGFTDANFLIPIDPAVANKKAALSCDSVIMKMTTIVGNRALTDSIGLAINYGNADGNESELTSFLFAFGEISIRSGGNTQKCQIDTSAYVIEFIGNNKTMLFDLNNCLNGISLNQGDQIDFIGHFAINPEGPLPTNTFKKVPELRAKGYAILNGVLYDECDSYGELFRIAKLNTTFSGPNNSTYPQGCANSNLLYTVSKSINANAMREFFGEEHRQAVKVDSLRFIYDPNILTSFNDLSVEYRIQGSEWFPLPNLEDSFEGIYKVGFSNASTASSITGSNQVFQFRVNLLPECSSTFGSITGDDLYELEAKINYNNRFYAHSNGNSLCVEQKEAFDKRIFQYSNAPQFSLEAVIGEVQSAEQNIQWIIEHCNESFLSDAGTSFIELQETIGEMEVLTIENISSLTEIDTLALSPFGTGNSVFAFTNGLSRRTTNVNTADICNTFRITARMLTCGQNSMMARVGWNCTTYDDPNWTPDKYAPCETENIELKASSLDPFLSASFQETASNISGVLCDTSSMVIIVRNEELGNAYDIQSQIILPTGATLVTGSIEFAYPSNASFQTIEEDPIFLDNSDQGKIYQYDDFQQLNFFLHQNGLPGFSINAPDSSEFKIKYRFITNCDYENGELNRYSFIGKTPCGEATNTAFAETNPIIFQADPGVTREFDIQFSTNKNLKEGQNVIINIIVQNISDNLSADDKLEIELPEGLTYIANSIQASAPSNWIPDEPVIKNNEGVGVFNLLLPSGITQNESAIFQFEVTVSSFDCDSAYTAKIATTSSIEFSCTIDNEVCIYDFNSSNEAIFPLNIACEPNNCSINIGTENISLLMPNCDSNIYYCLNQYTPEELENYTIYDNGLVADSSRFSICDYRQVCIYTYAQINAITGKISVDAWTVNGITYTAFVNSIPELLDSMNVWDKGGNWIILPDVLIIQGGHLGGIYSQIEITFPEKEIQAILGYDTRLTPMGKSIFLNQGIHELWIKDENECTDTLIVEVIQQNCPTCTKPIIRNTIIENANCGTDNGKVTINLTQDPANYNFIWSPNVGEGTHIRTNLPSASYLVQIVDKNSNVCFETLTINVGNGNGPSASYTKTATICGETNGIVALKPANFVYNWSDGGEGANRNDLAEGQYIITVIDPENPICTNLLTIEIEPINNLIVSHTVFKRANCLNNNGVIALDVSGGSGQYYSSFPDGNLAQSELTGGTYKIIVTDEVTGCSSPYLLVLNNEIHNGAITILNTIGVACKGDNSGFVNFEIVYESGFRYPADTIITDGQKEYVNGQLPAGNYQIIIQDGNGCVAGNQAFQIHEPDGFYAEIAVTGDCDSTYGIQVEISGGIPGYSYNWEDLLGTENDKNRTGLTNGTFNLIILDSLDCNLSIPIELPECQCMPPTGLTANIVNADCDEPNGVVAIDLDQNVEDYIFSFEPDLGQEGATKNTRMLLPPGMYLVQVTYQDRVHCVDSIQVIVEENDLTNNFVTSTDIILADCGQLNGSITLNIDGAIADYTFEWPLNTGQIGSTPNMLTQLSAGDYEVTISLANNPNCTTIYPFTIPIGAVGENPISETIISEATCGQNDGQVQFIFDNNSTQYNYEWIPNIGEIGLSQNSRIKLSEGTYQVTFSEVNHPDCAYSVELSVPTAPFTTEATIFPTTCITPPTGTVVLSPSNYIYSWPDGFEGNSRNQLEAGTYEISFTNSNADENCQGTISILINTENELTAEAIINKAPTCNEPNGSVSINVSGGSGDYSYSWNSDNNTDTNLAAGTYTVSVFDATLGCQTIIDFEVEAIPVGEAIISITDTVDVSCENGADGSIQFSLTLSEDFPMPIDTIISNGVDTFENGQLPVGEYCMTIRDGSGCLAGETCFTIGETTALMLLYDVFAACADTGGIRLTISGGEAPYLVDWTDLEGTDNPINRTALDTGTYEVSILDNNGCLEMASIFVPNCEECNPPTITEITTTPTACTGNTGSIFIQLVEDERDYDFFYTPNVGQPFVTNNIRGSLPKGKYTILAVYKPNPTCMLEFEAEIFEKDFNDFIPITSPADCGLANGQANLQPATNIYTWPDGFIGNSRADLKSGFYEIMVRDEEFECDTSFIIIVGENNLLQAKLAINNTPTCGNSDGSVTLSINGGSGDYSFDWEGGLATRTNLSSGTYVVQILDNRTGCKLPFVFTLLNESSALAQVEINEIFATSCPLEADGAIDFTVNLENVPEIALDTIISNGFTNFQNDLLPQGNYCVSIIDSMACTYGQACFTITAPELLSVQTEIIPECDEGGSISVEIEGGVAPYIFDWADVQGFEDQANRNNLPAGKYHLTVIDANGCELILDSLEVAVCEPCPLKFGTDTIIYNLLDCNLNQEICLDYDFDTRNPYRLTLNGQPIDLFEINSCGIDTLDTYTVETLFGQGRIGAYTITAWPVNDTIYSGDFTSLAALLTAMNDWDPAGDWTFSQDSSLITGGAAGSTYGQIDATVQGSPISSFLAHETELIQRGISTSLGHGVHIMTIEDPKTFCEDTLIILITCTVKDTIRVITNLGDLDTFCLNTLELVGSFDTSIIECLSQGKVATNIYQDSCIIFEGLAIGNDTLCVSICDEFGVCDTTVFQINIQYDTLQDTILVQNTNTICLDTTGLALGGVIMTMTEVCRDTQQSLANYEFDVNLTCITYTGQTVGQEEVCIEVCDDLGLCDTIEFILTVRNSPPDNVVDTIFVGETIIYCFDPLIFPGQIQYFENDCPDNSGQDVDYFLDPINFCVEYSGVDIGREQACIVICDGNNICDTAFFDVEVIEFMELPIAVNDVDTTDKGVPTVLNVKENDTPFGVGEDGLNILDQPLFGEAIPNLDGSITYFGDEYCEREDQFTYTLCNSTGCDTATVTIYIKCVDIEIFTAVSPNSDGINDFFYISGIDKFPLSKLTIYNRWGNIVYQTVKDKGYDNKWSGTWKNNQELPDGTYFYFLELKDPNDNRKFEGYLELHR